MKHTFTIPGAPVPKARARTVRIHGRTRSFTPEATIRYGRLVGMCARTAGVKMLVGPVRIFCTFYLPDLRPRDGDNLEKAVWDSLQGIAFKNDAQVCEWGGAKLLDKTNPRAVVTIEELPPLSPSKLHSPATRKIGVFVVPETVHDTEETLADIDATKGAT